MLCSSSPFWRRVESPEELTFVDDNVKFDGSFGWVWTRIEEESASDDEDERQQRPSKRQKTKGDDDPNPDMDDPSTWQVEETAEDLQALVEDAASKGVALPREMLTFFTTQRIHDAYFDTVNAHYPSLGRQLIPFQDGFLVECLRCNQDANFLFMYLTKHGNDHCVVWANEDFRWDEQEKKTDSQPNNSDDDEEQPQQPAACDFYFYAESVEEGLYKLMVTYDMT